MAHHQKAVAAAAALNSGIFAVEAVAGYQAGSLALLMDSVHNLSDEMALVFLYLAFILPLGVSRNLLRSANVFNSVGLIAVSALLLWQVIEQVLHPLLAEEIKRLHGLFGQANMRSGGNMTPYTGLQRSRRHHARAPLTPIARPAH